MSLGGQRARNFLKSSSSETLVRRLKQRRRTRSLADFVVLKYKRVVGRFKRIGDFAWAPLLVC